MITTLPLSYYNQPWIIEGQKAQLGLKVSPSYLRWASNGLDQWVIPAATPVAVFIEDVYNADMASIDFYLDAVFHHTEGSAPWDYDGTDGFGNANLVTFASGLHTIDAIITFGGASFITPNPLTVSAQFQVL